MTRIDVEHTWVGGVRIVGRQLAVSLQARDDVALMSEEQNIEIRLEGRADAWGEYWTGLRKNEVRQWFRLADVTFENRDGKEVMRAHRVSYSEMPGFRLGFELSLEPGMRELIETALPKIVRVADLAKALSVTVERRLMRKVGYLERRGLLRIAARAVLEGDEPQHAIAVKLGSDRNRVDVYAELTSAIHQPDVLSLLADSISGTTRR
ncbi:hypothetical protein [Pandoraea communis]|uniref:hypothetical protein n=1 Tax=Pandoraea communis TaxID=2508297 RepID=UPI0025A52252|nr:hypothetical protein [Pandoraea communis]MDM8356622.1 hypothetical protein [Pandoraea communis]